MTTTPFSPSDMQRCHTAFGAACGHGALAAALKITVLEATTQYFGRGGWVNVPIMETAISRAGKRFTMFQGWPDKPDPAVTLIQFKGPWMDRGVPPAARCKYRHWIAVEQGLIWDANDEHWSTLDEWDAGTLKKLLPPRSTGWEAFRTLYIF